MDQKVHNGIPDAYLTISLGRKDGQLRIDLKHDIIAETEEFKNKRVTRNMMIFFQRHTLLFFKILLISTEQYNNI